MGKGLVPLTWYQIPRLTGMFTRCRVPPYHILYTTRNKTLPHSCTQTKTAEHNIEHNSAAEYSRDARLLSYTGFIRVKGDPLAAGWWLAIEPWPWSWLRRDFVLGIDLGD